MFEDFNCELYRYHQTLYTLQTAGLPSTGSVTGRANRLLCAVMERMTATIEAMKTIVVSKTYLGFGQRVKWVELCALKFSDGMIVGLIFCKGSSRSQRHQSI